VRSSKLLGLVFALIALGAFWWARPQGFNQLFGGAIVANLGPAEHPRELHVPIALIVVAPFALRFGLPLLLKGALLLPYAATALSHGMGRRGPTFDPARDLAADSIVPGSQEEAAVDAAIAAALAARGQAAPPDVATPTSPPRAFGRRDAAA